MNLKKIEKILSGSLVCNNFDVEILKISSFAESDFDSAVFVFNYHYLKNIKKAGLVIIDSDKNTSNFNFNFLIVKNVKLALAKLAVYFSEQYLMEPPFDTLSDLRSDKGNLLVGENVFIHEHVVLGSNVSIGNNVVINKNVVIGDNVVIDSGSIIGSEGFGNIQDLNKRWKHITHIGGVRIANNVMIGSNVCIDRGTIGNTIISNGVIIDNLVHVAHNVFIDEDTAIAAKTGIAGSCKIGKRNMIGGMVGIVDHITTADDVIISATSTVNKDIKKPGLYTGILPILEHANWKRIAFWISKLDKIAKSITLKK